MKRSNRLILLIGLFLAVVAFVGVIMLTGNTSSGGGTAVGPSPSPTTAKVVKAAVDIAAGTTVTASMVELDEVPLAAAGPDTIPDTGNAIGKTIRQSVNKGETLGYSFFVSSGVEANVTDGLPRGLRAMAIQVSQVTGVGTLITTFLIGQITDRFSFQPVVIAASIIPCLATVVFVTMVRASKRPDPDKVLLQF